MPPVFKIYSSSAGSGKTYNLTKEYLKLALHTPQPDYYRNILAITFTNDAAQEMKERILKALRSFNDPRQTEKEKQKSEQLLQTITREIQEDYPEQENITVEEVRKRAALVFQQVLYHYSEFAVSTIDSFVNKVVTAFTRELNIPHNFEVDLDSRTLLSTAVSLLLNRVNKQPENQLLTETIGSYALEKADEGRSWNMLPDELADFANNLLNEQVYEAVSELQGLSLEDFRKIRQALFAEREQVETQVKQLAQQALDLIQNAGLSEGDLSYGRNGIYGFFSKCVRDFDINYSNKNAEKTIEKDSWASGKANAYVKNQLDGIKGELTDLYNQIETIKAANAERFTLISAMVPHLYKVSVLNELEKCIQEIKQDKNLVHISEFNKKIADIVLQEPVPFIYERLGERYNHILIDEFQDTSLLQWNNLLPLVDNALANGHFNMVVGDAKQAIYRWRGGEMEQILHLYKQNTQRLHQGRRDADILSERYYSINHSLAPADLNTNYRSAGEIIGFNNKLFEYISRENPQFEMLQSIYDENFQQAVPGGAAKEGAHIQVIFTHDDDLNYQYQLDTCARTEEFYEDYTQEQLLTYQESNLNMVLQHVRHALAEGYEPRDIAVLSRTNANSKLVANFLKEKKFDIISQDSLSLQFAEVVNLIICLFRIFNRSNDTLARSEALYLICKVILKVIPDNEMTQTIAEIANQADNEAFFEKLRDFGYDLEEKETGNLSIYELTEKLIRIFDLLGKNNECDYLFRFLDLVLEYSLKHSNNLNNFLEYWELHKERLSINTPKDRNAITITSIHKSKGLAYPVVIVPFCDWSTEPKRGQLLWGRLADEIAPETKLTTAVVNLSSKLESTSLKEQYQAELEKTFIENLNMLYVAFTRPIDRLYIIAQRKDFSQERNRRNVSFWLYRYLQHLDLWQDEQLCYQLSKGRQNGQTHLPPTGHNFYLDHFTSADWTQRLRLKQHANNVFDFETQQKQRDWNKKVHFALSRLSTAAELDTVLRQLLNEGVISTRDRSRLSEVLQGVVQHPQLSRYFSDEVTVENEKEVLDVRAYLYKPDRIVFDNGKVVLIDYKTLPKTEEHRQQLDFYAHLFKDLGHKKVERVLFYFDVQEAVKWG